MKKFLITKEEELKLVAEHLLFLYPKGGVILLKGCLGAGKSTFVKEFAKLFSIDYTASPTFSLMNNYEDTIYHYDIYKDGSEEFFLKGLNENLERDGYHFIEWADEKILNFLELTGLEYGTVTITPIDNTREVIIQ